MNDSLLNTLTNNDQKWNKRWKYNCAIFILSYIFMGAVTGITNDSYVSYLQLTVPDVVKAIPTYASISTFTIAIVLLFVHKFGYKKIILLAPLITVASLLTCIYSPNATAIMLANIFLNVGIGMFDSIYPLMFTSYTPKQDRTLMFSRVMYCNLISQALVTFFNGKIVVWKFSKSLHTTYDKAAVLSENSNNLTSSQLASYLSSYKFVLWIALILTVISLLFLFFLKEQVDDYRETAEEKAERKSENKFNWHVFANKYVIMWVVIFSIVRFGALLVVPYFPIYLNNFLHISRGTVSSIITFQTISMVLAYFATPYLEKKFGAIVTIAGATLLCIPLMLIMANGAMFGSNVAWIIGVTLFFRSGVANASLPIEGSLPLTFVSKDLVPAYNSFLMVTMSIVGFFTGLFSRFVLLRTDAGYGRAYYIASAIYAISMIMLLLVFTKKYNRSLDKEPTKESKEETIPAN